MRLSNIKKGFTLIELLVVISIIGLLVAAAAASYSNAQRKGRDARRMEDMKTIQAAMEQYYSTDGGNTYGTVATALDGAPVPTDPKSGFTYNTSGANITSTGYCICAQLEASAGNASSMSADPTCDWSAGGDYFCVQNQQ